MSSLISSAQQNHPHKLDNINITLDCDEVLFRHGLIGDGTIRKRVEMFFNNLTLKQVSSL